MPVHTCAVFAAVALNLGAFVSPAFADARLPGASSDDHLWVVVDRDDPTGERITLQHDAREADGSHLSGALPLSRVPEAIAAWDNRLWLVMPPQRQDRQRREAFTVEILFNPLLRSWFHSPHDHLRAVESIEGAGRLEGLVGTAEGPVALISPGPRDAQGSARLLQLRAGRWGEQALPEGFRAGGRCHLAAAGDDGRILVILHQPDHGRPPVVWWRDGEARWTQSAPAAAVAALCCTTRIDATVLLIIEEEDRLKLAYLRPHRLLELADLPRPDRRFAVLGLSDGPRLIEEGERGELLMRRIDPMTGAPGPAEAMTQKPVVTGRVLYGGALVALAIMAALIALAARPGPQWGLDLPPGVRVVGPVARLAAVAVDLALGAAVSLAVLRCGLADLFRLPLLAADLSDAAPGLLLVGVTVAHCAIGELVFSRSAGKALVGARVAARDGSRPPAASILVRNIFKAMVLLIPVLAVFALLNPHLQGPGDLVARTVVVGGAPARPGDVGKDR